MLVSLAISQADEWLEGYLELEDVLPHGDGRPVHGHVLPAAVDVAQQLHQRHGAGGWDGDAVVLSPCHRLYSTQRADQRHHGVPLQHRSQIRAGHVVGFGLGLKNHPIWRLYGSTGNRGYGRRHFFRAREVTSGGGECGGDAHFLWRVVVLWKLVIYFRLWVKKPRIVDAQLHWLYQETFTFLISV